MVPIGQRGDHSRQQEEERGCVAAFLSKGLFFSAKLHCESRERKNPEGGKKGGVRSII